MEFNSEDLDEFCDFQFGHKDWSFYDMMEEEEIKEQKKKKNMYVIALFYEPRECYLEEHRDEEEDDEVDLEADRLKNY